MYPTTLSNTRLACCESTRFSSIILGFSSASRIDFFVISLNSILFFSPWRPNRYAMCQAIASPSLSLSVAIYTLSAFFAAAFISFITGALPLILMYSGSKVFISTPSLDFGKSLICPFVANTLLFFPKNLEIVLAFVGDSTIIKFNIYFLSLQIIISIHICQRLCWQLNQVILIW